MVPILHLPRNYWKLLGIKMLYVKDIFCAIDKYLKNDEKFKYFSIQLKYTIEGVSKILVPRDQIYFPRRSRGK